MNASLLNSAVSMATLQQRIDIIANNIANVGTTGYKRKEATFQDILTTYRQQPETMVLPGRLSPPGFTEGWGARLSRQFVDLSQGSLMPTEQMTDFALEGDALFELLTPVRDETGAPVLEDGVPVYETTWTRDGSFKLTTIAGDPDFTMLTTQDGRAVLNAAGEPIRVPLHHRLVIDTQGQMMAYNDSDEAFPLGQLRLVRVTNPQLLESVGANQYALPDNVARDAVLLTLGDPDAVAAAGVTVNQGFLEQSNVDMAAEMTELIGIQRSLQLSARALSSADTMMGLANNLRGT